MSLHLDIVTPEKKIFSDTVDNVYLPASEGEMGVLELHAALVTPIIPGELRYLKDGQVHELAVGEGFAEVSQKEVRVLTDLAVTDAEIDEQAVQKAMERAEKALAETDRKNTEEMTRIEIAMAKSMAQLKLKRKRKNL